jgi:hypothetical protein
MKALGAPWHGSQREYYNVFFSNSLRRVTVCTLYSHGEPRAQRPSVDALVTLLLTSPDHAGRLVSDSLPALRDILEDDHRSLDVYISALSLLAEIANTAAHSLLIIESGITKCVVQWLR